MLGLTTTHGTAYLLQLRTVGRALRAAGTRGLGVVTLGGGGDAMIFEMPLVASQRLRGNRRVVRVCSR